jgi:hypothetical protein
MGLHTSASGQQLEVLSDTFLIVPNTVFTSVYTNFYHCSVHSDICTVHSPTDALLLIKKN